MINNFNKLFTRFMCISFELFLSVGRALERNYTNLLFIICLQQITSNRKKNYKHKYNMKKHKFIHKLCSYNFISPLILL